METINRNRRGYIWLVNLKQPFHNFLQDFVSTRYHYEFSGDACAAHAARVPGELLEYPKEPLCMRDPRLNLPRQVQHKSSILIPD